MAIPTDAEFDGIWFTDSLHGWVAGGGYLIDGGIVGRTADGGRTWRFQSGVAPGRGPEFHLHRVQFRDSLRGLAVGDVGVILVTADGGESWRPAHEVPAGAGLSDVQLLDERMGWAVGPGSILRTEDGGETWRTLARSSPENGYLSGCAIHFIDARRGWMVGHGGTVMRSEDGGETWSNVPMPLRSGEHPTLWDVTFADPSHGWIVGDLGSIFHTEDGGATWTRQEQGVPVNRVNARRQRDVLPELETEPDRLSVSALWFTDESHGCAVGYYADVAQSIVLRTDDGGATWRVERIEPGTLLRSLHALDSRHAWAVGNRARRTPQVVLRYRACQR